MHGDDFQDDSRRLRPQYEADGSEEASQNVFLMPDKCKRIDNQGNPFDSNEKQLLNSLHRMDCYAQQEASLQ